ncbi:MAG: diguanylate cyclase [Spirochaetales bacterium]|nr:diguanylate cyclase [Spirochaetales bacterium]
MKKNKRSTIIKRFLLLLIFFIIVATTSVIFFYFSFSSKLKIEKKTQTQILTQALSDIVEYLHEIEKSSAMTEEQAKKLAINALKNARYENNGYFWINATNGDMIMHPFADETYGPNQMDLQDIKGNFFFREFLEKARDGGGWVEYYWPKPGETKAYKKIAYVVIFEEWEWIIGTGIYVDEMDASIFKTLLQTSGVISLLLLVFIVFIFFEARSLIKDLNELAIKDNLTGLYSKFFFNETIKIFLKRHKRNPQLFLTLFFLDLDHFKRINDTYGHAIGDMVLEKVGKILLDNTRSEDLCVRYGGEEFLIAGFFNTLEEVQNYAERIRSQIEGTNFLTRKYYFNATISIGIAAHDQENSIEKTIKTADKQLYIAKSNGRNRVEIDDSLKKKAF